MSVVDDAPQDLLPEVIEVHNTGWEPVLRDSGPPYMIRWRYGVAVPLRDQALVLAEQCRIARLGK